MESFLLILLLIPYMVFKYFLTDHETLAEKDRKWFAEGRDLLQKGQNDAAFEYFNSKAKQYPKSAVAYLYRGKSNLALGNLYSALYDFTQSSTLDNTIAECYYLKGLALFELQEYDASFREFDKAVWYYRSADAEAMRWRAIARWRIGQTDQAEKDLERAVVLGDEHAQQLLFKLRQRKMIQ
jgi:tetratricopeptide (TPR) repeat protein